jgi:hypothetical protein
VSSHFKRDVDTWVADDPIVTDPDLRDVRIEKSNLLLIGPSGSEKTHLVRSLASSLNVPLLMGDATSLTRPAKSRTRRDLCRAENQSSYTHRAIALTSPTYFVL